MSTVTTGTTYEEFGFGTYNKTYTGYTVLGGTDFSGSAEVDAAFAYVYNRDGGVKNIDIGNFAVGNCCIAGPSTSTPFYGFASNQFMTPNSGGAFTCTSQYSEAILQLQGGIPANPLFTTVTTAQLAATTVSNTSTCDLSSNPGLFVKRYQ
jgi:hypothetical protein